MPAVKLIDNLLPFFGMRPTSVRAAHGENKQGWGTGSRTKRNIFDFDLHAKTSNLYIGVLVTSAIEDDGLREELVPRADVIGALLNPNRPNRDVQLKDVQPGGADGRTADPEKLFSFSKRIYKLRGRIESASQPESRP
jgi:hypothetical protein